MKREAWGVKCKAGERKVFNADYAVVDVCSRTSAADD